MLHNDFTNKKKYIYFDYTILSQSLCRITAVKDLRVTLTSNWNFKDHTSRNVCKVFCKELKMSTTSKALFRILLELKEAIRRGKSIGGLNLLVCVS